MTNTELIAAYLDGADLLRRTVAGMTPEQARARPVAGRWSTLEVVSHLADFEPIFADRIKRIIAMDRPLLIGADEVPYSQTLCYQERNLDNEVELVALTRRQLATILRASPAEIWQRIGVHSHAGHVTIEQLLAQSTRHIPHHVPFIVEKKNALGIQ